MSDEREQLIYFLRIQFNNGVPNEGMEDQMEYIDIMKKIIELNPVLSEDEKVLLSLVYKNAVTSRRNGIREVETYLQDPSNSNRPSRQQKLVLYLSTLKRELKDICLDLINLINETLLPQSFSGEQRVFYEKMKGDYYRYICENKSDDSSDFISKASQCYDDAIAIAKSELSPTSSAYLGVVLNYSVFLYEIMGFREQAIDLASRTFTETVDNLDSMSPDYNESVMILRLLRENHSLWTEKENN